MMSEMTDNGIYTDDDDDGEYVQEYRVHFDNDDCR